jgi:hypothetical protein
MGYPSTDDLVFRAKVARWIAARGEVLALIRYSHSAGAKDFEFFTCEHAFRARLAGLPPRSCVTIFGERQFPLRGRVDDAFIDRALTLVPDGVEFAVVALERVRGGPDAGLWQVVGERSLELAEALRAKGGELVAVGRYPPWLADGEEVVSAVVPNPDGSVAPGVY